ncbi:LysR substrate-binding domain-containing protein [Streptomyces roseolus]|uniref:LysR substrate-binding domain-containing protein n=1 Tax=Streptomyces roseolus TaxID=67358 RepID=UPI00340C5A81
MLPRAHRFARRDALDPVGPAAEPRMLGCPKTEAYLRRFAERAGFDPEIRGTTTHCFPARSLVAAGTGTSPVPSVAPGPEAPGVRTVPIAPPGPVRYVGVATTGGRDRPRVAAPVRALREEAGRHDGGR